MKRILFTFALAAICATAQGQGRVNFNNTGRPVTLTTDTKVLYPADVAAGWAGKPVPVPNDSGVQLPSGIHLFAGLFAGATAGSETLITTVPISDGTGLIDGYWGQSTITLPGLPAGVTTYFFVTVFVGPYPPQGFFFGSSPEFTAIPAGPSPAFSSLTGSSSTWPAGPLYVSDTPEPSTFALAGLALSALLAFRRR